MVYRLTSILSNGGKITSLYKRKLVSVCVSERTLFVYFCSAHLYKIFNLLAETRLTIVELREAERYNERS